MTGEGGRLRATLVLLLLVSAALFAIGMSVERHQHTEANPAASESAGHTEAPSEAPGHTEGSSESGGEAHPSEAAPAAGEAANTSEELFGVNPESVWMVILGVVASVLLALAVRFSDRPIVLVAVIVFGLLLAALDLREMVHQINESRTSLVVLSLILALLHLGVAGIAGVLLRPRVAAQVAT